MTAVTFVVPRYLPRLGGIEVHVREVTSHLARRGHDVEVLSQAADVPRVTRSRPADGVLVTMQPGTRDILGQGISLGSWRAVRRAWRGDRVLHLQNYHALSTLLVGTQPGAGRRGGPLVLTPHYLGLPENWHRHLHAPYGLGMTPLLRALDAIVCVAASEAEALVRDHGVRAERIRLIPNGVDVDLLAHAEPVHLDHRAVLAAGRMVEYKGHRRLVEALPHLPDDVHLHLAGDGEDLASFLTRAAELGVADRVHAHGRLAPSELASLYAAADVVASLSERECFGMTLAEGFAAGARVVASDIGAHRDVVALCGADETALLPAEAGAARVAGALSDALAAGRPGRGAVWAPSWDFVAGEHERLYEELGA